MSFLEIALSCIARGWYVFPCVPRDKMPLKGVSGYRDATLDEAQVRAWLAATPEANVAIAPGKSGFTVLDCDHGFKTMEDWEAWRKAKGLPRTYTVRTGRRVDKETGENTYNVQMYYADPVLQKSIAWEDGAYSGDIRSNTGHVMAAGCVHPDSGELYEVLDASPLSPIPVYVRTIPAAKPKDKEGKPLDDITDDGGIIDHHRNVLMIKLLGKKRAEGADDEELREYAIELNATRFSPSLDEDELERLILNACKFPIPEPKIEVLIHGKSTAEVKAVLDTVPKDWRELFHTRDEVLNCPPPSFLIQDFLARQAICALAAPVAQRKSLIALNVARSLCTGEVLFGFLPVINKPSRVLYLCPEMGLVSLSDRVRRMGIGDCLGENLFVRSMNMQALELMDIPEEALEGSVLIIDTAIRYIRGDENGSEDMKTFSDTLFSIQRRQGQDGAILALYHSPKATKDASELTLENCIRGSGELGAAITDAHGTRLQGYDVDPYKDTSFLRHIKCRDYKGVDDFEFTSNLETGILTRSSDSSIRAVLSSKARGNKADKDGKDEAARTIVEAALKAEPRITVDALIGRLKDAGITRKKTWVTNTRIELRGTGVKHAE